MVKLSYNPCSRRYFLSAEKPIFPAEVFLKLKEYDEAAGQCDVRFLRRDAASQRETYYASIAKMATSKIRESAHRRKEAVPEIEAWVLANFQMDDRFALGVPMALLERISTGIDMFTVEPT